MFSIQSIKDKVSLQKINQAGLLSMIKYLGTLAWGSSSLK